MVSRSDLSSIFDGLGHRAHRDQYACRAGSAVGKKVGLRPHSEVSRGVKKDKVRANKYRRGLGWVPWVELLIGCYFAITVYYAIENENYITVPFLILFVLGYWYTGLMSLLQGRFTGIALSAETHTKPFPVGV